MLEGQKRFQVEDKLFKYAFENSKDPQYILDYETQVFIDINPAFEELFGYSRKDIREGKLKAKDVVSKEDMLAYYQKKEFRKDVALETYELNLVSKDGRKIPAEISVRRIEVGGRTLIIGSIRDISRRKHLELELWERIKAVVQSSNRLLALTEQIRNIPYLTLQLLTIEQEEDLISAAASKMTAPTSQQGLGYKDVNVYLFKDALLTLVYSTKGARRRRLPSSHRFMDVFLGNTQSIVSDERAIFAIKGRERNLGVVEVFFEPKIINALKGNEEALKAYQEGIVATIVSGLGLCIDNVRLHDALRIQSLIDPLTSVFNRRHLDSALEKEIQRVKRYERNLSVMLLDIDNFKQINDTYGHKEGDIALIEFANLLKTNLRKTDIICRYGGDEFLVIMTETSLANTIKKAETLRNLTKEHEFSNIIDPEKGLRFTISAGVAGYNSSIADADAMLKLVDEALYEAKRTGKDRVCVAPS